MDGALSTSSRTKSEGGHLIACGDHHGAGLPRSSLTSTPRRESMALEPLLEDLRDLGDALGRDLIGT